MEFEPGNVFPEVVLVKLSPVGDNRGSFARTYCEREFADAGLPTRWQQCNHTVTRAKGSVRGMHWQAPPHGEAKLVRCVAGTVFDVVVDVREGSETFGQWESFELSESNDRQLFIPAGFAHGFQCLTANCGLFYQMSEFYDPASARGLRWDDPAVAVPWPLEPGDISERDASLPLLDAI